MSVKSIAVTQSARCLEVASRPVDSEAYYNEVPINVPVSVAMAMVQRPNRAIQGFYLDSAEAFSERCYHLDGHVVSSKGVDRTVLDIRFPGNLARVLSWTFGRESKATVCYTQLPGIGASVHDGARDRYMRLYNAAKEEAQTNN